VSVKIENRYQLWLLACLLLLGNSLVAQNVPLPADSLSLLNDSLPPAAVPPNFTDTVPRDQHIRFTIRKVVITGNKVTHENIILREIPFHETDQFELKELVRRFELGRRNLMNTALFHEVVVAVLKFEGIYVDVLVDVKERWYIFPVPYFKLIDRNFNQWWVEQNRSLERVNYGLKVIHNNTTGRNDKLNIWLINGYTKQISMNYDRLYIDKRMRWGFKAGFAIGKNREVNFITERDKQQFLKSGDFIRNFKNFNLEATYRRAINTRHRFGISYTDEQVGDTVIRANPDYFPKGVTRVRYPEFSYSMTYFNVDYNPYPLSGYAAELSLVKRGITRDFNMWQLTARGSGNWELGHNYQFHLSTTGSLKLPFKQPFFNRRLLGYSSYVLQGYEYYVIDGVATGYAKATFTKRILNFTINFPALKYTKPARVPIRVFAKIYGNTGYVYDPDPGANILSNRMLYTGGFGIDIVTFYDFVMKFEWSFNQLGQNGLYLQRKSIF